MTVSDDTQPLAPEDIPVPKVAKTDNSVSPAPAKKKATPVARHVVGKGDTDEVLLSRAVPLQRAKTRKSLTIHHLQRRLAELGFPEAASDIDGRWGELTGRAVSDWQKKNGHPEGDLTGKQFTEIFEGDPNVTAVVDTPQFDV